MKKQIELSNRLTQIALEFMGDNADCRSAAVVLLHLAASLIQPDQPWLRRLEDFSAIGAASAVQFNTGEGEPRN